MGAIPIIGRESVTVIRKVFDGRDELGKAKWVESVIVVPNCVIAPRTTERRINGVTEYVYDTSYSIYFPAGTDILADDVFIFRGDRYFKDGSPKQWELSGDTFNPAGIEVNVRLIEGEDNG